MEYISFENLSHAKSSTKGNWIPVREMRRYVNSGPGRFQGRYWTSSPLISCFLSFSLLLPALSYSLFRPRFSTFFLSSLSFFLSCSLSFSLNASSFLIAANRDVKTIRVPLARLGTRCSILFWLSVVLLHLSHFALFLGCVILSTFLYPFCSSLENSMVHYDHLLVRASK